MASRSKLALFAVFLFFACPCSLAPKNCKSLFEGSSREPEQDSGHGGQEWVPAASTNPAPVEFRNT